MDSQTKQRARNRRFIPTAEQNKLMVALYMQGKPLQYCAAQAGFASHGVAKKAIVAAGVKMRTKFEVHRKYQVNHHFYDEITTETQAYWLGFTYTDGCILETDYTISFCLGRNDHTHLEKLKRDALIGNPVHFGQYRRNGKEYKTCTLGYHSKPVWTALQKMGMTFRKSHTVIPPMLPEDLERHFWRGAVDGDGTISFGHKSYYWTVRFVGSYAMVNGFIHFVEKHIDHVKTKSPKKVPGCYAIGYHGVDLPQKIVKLLYGDASVYLDRKNDLAHRLMAETPKKRNLEQRDFTSITQSKLDEMRNRLPSWAAVGRELNLTSSGITQLRHRVAGTSKRRTGYRYQRERPINNK